jgi:hypothetical protein
MGAVAPHALRRDVVVLNLVSGLGLDPGGRHCPGRCGGIKCSLANRNILQLTKVPLTKYNFLFDGGTRPFVCFFPLWTAGRRETSHDCNECHECN